jgi:predicted ATPase/DNA-binding SARP family transcriptional activator/Tfp pilus assembly protein PilF
MDALFHIEMLGRFGVRQGSREITRFRTQKTASLLAFLSLHPARAHPRDVLVEQFWPSSEMKAARSNLSVALNALRRQLEPPDVPAGAVLITDYSHVRLNSATFTTDVADFQDTLRRAELETETANRVAFWINAIELYRGDLLPGFYEDWVFAERDRLRDAYQNALRHTVKGCAELRQPERAIEYARRMVQVDPHREESHRLLMRLLMAVGRPQDALYQYQELERLLRTELQIAPSAVSRELATQLRHISVPPRKTLQAPASDSQQTERTAAIPSPSADTPRLTHRIPLQFTRFFGREEEIRRLGKWMGVGEAEDGHNTARLSGNTFDPSAYPRLITLTGPGGTGKTRLASEIAGHVREAFSGGLWFIPLVELNDPLRLDEVLRDALELPRQTQASALDQVIAFLSSLTEPFLLILDNFEQIVTGGAPLVWTLLNRVPQLRCLVTSRQPLSLPGEREIPILPLPVPEWKEESVGIRDHGKSISPSELLKYPSVALFVDRAQAARPEFQITPRNAGAIAAICVRLEGIPLALELAAARARALTPAQILERLTERFELLASQRTDKGERHRSLWATIDWSYHLLSLDLQRLFARLSVFHGGWTLEAAEAVCMQGTIGRYLTPLDALAQLRGHSLLHMEESSETLRFRMLETLREFAAEQMVPEEREESERRHAAYFHHWVTGARYDALERIAWFARIEEDFDNLRAVLAWSLREENDIEIGLQAASACGNFWWLRGHLSEGRRWYARLLERAGDSMTEAVGKSLHGAGTLAYLQGDYRTALPLLDRCMEVARATNNVEIMGGAHEALGSITYRQGEYAQARFHYEQSLALWRAVGIGWRVAGALGNLANVAQSTGDFAASRALNEESLAIWREAGERNGEARTLHNLANLAHSQGQLTEARAYYEQSLEIKRELTDRYAASGTLRGIADVAIDQGDYATAAACARESLALVRELDARTELLEVLSILAELVRHIGEFEVAAQMYGALERLREEMNYPLPPVDREKYAQRQGATRNALGDSGYEAALAEGRDLSLEQALDSAEETLASHSL